MIKIMSVVGARPNFMKIAPFVKAIEDHNQQGESPGVEHILVHTGQHYDVRMSEAFFKSLGIPDPDINLEIGSGTHAEQVGHTMIEVEKAMLEHHPDWLVVVGDVNATLACSVAAKKIGVKVCHIEAGLRSGDMSMPEEINRLVTDRLSDLLLTPDKLSSENLKKEGVSDQKVVFVGNIMIDTLERNRQKAEKLRIKNIIEQNLCAGFEWNGQEIDENQYAVMTIHRPSNVDDPQILSQLVRFLLDELSPNHKLIWPVHPRTRKNLENFNIWPEIIKHPGVVLLEPIGYHEMLRLNMTAAIMLTDSGGLQEECCVLGTPCLTLRWNTERPVTLRENGGASVLVGNNVGMIRKEYNETIRKERNPQIPELWDGKTATRCLNAILNSLQNNS
jgi:UDP-N-acetylglucosamine 2-epimerase (non-hydrolysing)